MCADCLRPLSSKLKRREDDEDGIVSSPQDQMHASQHNGNHPHFGDSLAFLDDVLPMDTKQAGPSTRKESRHPLSQLEDDLGVWCARQGECWTEE